MKTFTLQEVGGGVWAAIAEPGGVAVGNAGFVDLGDETLVFDTTISLTAGRELRAAAEGSGTLDGTRISQKMMPSSGWDSPTGLCGRWCASQN